jgi:hypothetical protein
MNGRTRPHVALALAVGALSATGGCGGSNPGDSGRLPSRPADVHGTVASIQSAHNGVVSIVIDRGGACALSTRIPADVRVFREFGGSRTSVTIAHVAVGQKVDAWVGAVAESCPEQTTAEAIVIVAET